MILLLVATANFLPSLGFPLLSEWDDHIHVLNNRHLDFTWFNLWYWCRTPAVMVYMPVTMFSYMVDHLIGGLNPLGYRLQSLFWHLLMVFMIFRCFRAFGIRMGLAWMGAAIWAVHPQRLESVVWISERKDVLCGALYFWSLYCYLTAPDRDRFNWRAWTLMVLAVLSKPMAVSLPVVFMLIDFSRRQRWEIKYYVVKFIPYLIPVAVTAALALYTQEITPERTVDWGRQTLVILHNIYWYTIHVPVPPETNPICPRVIISSALVVKMALFYLAAGSVLLLLRLRLGWSRWYVQVLPPVLAYVISLLPIIGIFQLGFTDYADRYSYIPAVFLTFIIIYALQLLCRTEWLRRFVQAILFVYLLWLMYLSSLGIGAWYSFRHLLAQASQSQETNEMVLINLGYHEMTAGNYPAVWDIAARLEAEAPERERQYGWKDGVFYANLLRAKVASKTKRYAEADRILSSIYPSLTPKRNYHNQAKQMVFRLLITVKMGIGDYREAGRYIDLFLQLYDREDQDFFYYYYRGLKAGFAGNWNQAEADFQYAMMLNPGDVAVRGNLEHVRRQRRTGK